jgi:PfaD family protein
VVEASAYLDLTASVLYYRTAGLSRAADGSVQIGNRIIAKLSRREVAARFMQPAPENLLTQLLNEGHITSQQAELARQVPVADDVTVEADSGGHTDNRPLVCLLPTMLALRDELQAKYNFPTPVRVGAAGGISTPASALGAFMMGAAYIVTGSVNQACIEAGASEHTRSLLAQAGMADVAMAPSADMFEMGVKVQVLKHGTLFPMRALKLYELYNRYDSIDSIPADEREKLERQVFKRDLESIWQETVKFFSERDPAQIERANNNPKRKMALIFRWYLGLSSRWSNTCEQGREMDYQIWCGPAIGSFNDWTRGTYLAEPKNRRVVDVALQILTGAAYQYRVQALKLQGVRVPSNVEQYYPTAPLSL